MLIDHLIPHAKQACQRCWGKGYTYSEVATADPEDDARKLVDAGRPKEDRRPCACSLRRFMRRRSADLVITQDGRLYYLKQPAEGDASLGAISTDGVGEVVSGSDVLAEVRSGNQVRDRLVRMFQRISEAELAMKEVEGNYREALGDVREGEEAVRRSLDAQRERLREAPVRAAKLRDDMQSLVTREIERFNKFEADMAAMRTAYAADVSKTRAERQLLHQELDDATAAVEQAAATLAPLESALAEAIERVEAVRRKIHGRQTPHRQIVESLRTRIARLAFLHDVDEAELKQLVLEAQDPKQSAA